MLKSTSFLTAAAVSGLLLTVPHALADTVTVYSAAPGQLIDELIPAFERETGHRVELINAGGGELINRLRAEEGRQTADVLFSVGASLIDLNAELFQPYETTEAAAIDPLFASSGVWTPFTAVVMVMAVNEAALGGLPVPASWADLADPQYDDMISSAAPDRSSSAYTQLVTVLRTAPSEEEGWTIYEGILSNMVISPSSGAVPRFVNDGELAIGLTLEDAAERYRDGGGPVEIVYPSEGTAVLPDAMAIVKNAPSEEAAKAFVDFMASQAAQERVAAIGRRPVRTDVESKDTLVPLSEVTIAPSDEAWAAENQDRLLERWKDLSLDYL